MRSILLWILLSFVVAGCGEKKPTMSHGKPVSHWVAALKDRDPRVRQKAVTALGHAGNADPAALAALIEALKDHDAEIRAAVVLALLNLGPDAEEAIPALEAMKNDPDATVRGYVAKALARIRG